MSYFTQLHILTFYPASNPNRDDLGRPKTVRIGGKERQRISSQSLKRSWRTSDVFKQALGNGELPLSEHFQRALEDERQTMKPHPQLGVRTRDIAIVMMRAIENVAESEEWYQEAKADEEEKKAAAEAARAEAEGLSGDAKKKAEGKAKKAKAALEQAQVVSFIKPWALAVANQFGATDKNTLRNQQAFLFSMEELQRLDKLAQTLAKENRDPKKEELDELISHDHQMADIGMFGRMLAQSGDALFQNEAAVQVAHAFTVDEVVIEDDYFTAVDDLNIGAKKEGAGSAFLDTAKFGSGLYYIYFCIDCRSLVENLNSEDPEALAGKIAEALVQAATKVTPSGKRNPYGHHTYAHYVLAECGVQQPRSLAVAFQRAVDDEDVLTTAVKRLQEVRNNMDAVYGPCANDRYEAIPLQGIGSFEELYRFVREQGCPMNEIDETEA